MNLLISPWESYHHRLDSSVPELLQDENISPHTFLTDNTLHRLHIDTLHMDLSPKLLHSQKFPHCLLCNLDYRAKININKKVLLRERKRHTARRVASARYAALCNGGGVPHLR